MSNLKIGLWIKIGDFTGYSIEWWSNTANVETYCVIKFCHFTIVRTLEVGDLEPDLHDNARGSNNDLSCEGQVFLIIFAQSVRKGPTPSLCYQILLK